MTDRYAERKVVWILGSGFSKSLGGPLLNDLLSHRGRAWVKTRFPKIECDKVYEIYWEHLRNADESRMQPIYWDHAEEFLDFVETADRDINRTRYEILAELVSPGYTPSAKDELKEFRTQAHQCVGAECAFADVLGKDGESVQPYIEWGSKLNDNDTIITFNYDLVLERLGDFRPGIAFGAPTVGLVENKQLNLMTGLGCTSVLKLHGSFDWTKRGNSIVREITNDPFIATPGPGKYNACRGPLRPIWDEAEKRLKEADVIVFMGYRFPPSDSQSRSVLLNAIGENTKDHLKIHTVLGPRLGDDDTVRLLKLIEHAVRGSKRMTIAEHDELAPDQQTRALGIPGARTFAIVPQPLYVEDFLTVLHDEELFGP